jgi:hypothetical protein
MSLSVPEYDGRIPVVVLGAGVNVRKFSSAIGKPFSTSCSPCISTDMFFHKYEGELYMVNLSSLIPRSANSRVSVISAISATDRTIGESQIMFVIIDSSEKEESIRQTLINALSDIGNFLDNRKVYLVNVAAEPDVSNNLLAEYIKIGLFDGILPINSSMENPTGTFMDFVMKNHLPSSEGVSNDKDPPVEGLGLEADIDKIIRPIKAGLAPVLAPAQTPSSALITEIWKEVSCMCCSLNEVQFLRCIVVLLILLVIILIMLR